VVVVVVLGLAVVEGGLFVGVGLGAGAGGRHAASATAPTVTLTTSSRRRRMTTYRHPGREILKLRSASTSHRERRPYDEQPMPSVLPPVLGSIPSPADGNLGPFHMYGVILAVGVLVAVYVAEQRWRRRGYPKDGIYDISFWVVIWGVIGARVYHVITDYQLFDDDPLRAFEIWRGGLSIWGAVIGGALAVLVITRRRHLPTLVVMDCMAPGIVLAQAIGRWGNYFNQELFGKPTTLPWALEIAPQHRPAGYAQHATFQPTFLYESLACLAIVGILLLVERRAQLRFGQTFALYVVLYTFARFWFENMRIDTAHELAGLRVNAWVSVLCFTFGIVWFVWLGRHEPRQRRPGHVTDEMTVARSEPDHVS
jgi:prolipoprotein diacylglyceryl transferase